MYINNADMITEVNEIIIKLILTIMEDELKNNNVGVTQHLSSLF